MSTSTTNYNLTKPGPEEFYDVGVPNANMDKIDAALKALSDALGVIDLTTLSQAITAVENKVNEHFEDMAKHNQFIAGNKKYQMILGWNKTLNCPTMDYVEVVK
jgi:hypothetical protein